MIFCYADWHNALWRNVRREKTGAAGSVAHAGRLEAGALSKWSAGSIRIRIFEFHT